MAGRHLYDIVHCIYLIFFYELTSPLHLLTMYRAFVAAGAAYDSANLSCLNYIFIAYNSWIVWIFKFRKNMLFLSFKITVSTD